jgi:nucleoside-diphosphate-sugar epimerase
MDGVYVFRLVASAGSLSTRYSHLYGIATTGLRFFTVYGPWGRPDIALFLFTKAALVWHEAGPGQFLRAIQALQYRQQQPGGGSGLQTEHAGAAGD